MQTVRRRQVVEAPGTERKVVSVLFADLVGSTELAGRLDAERFREVMAAFFAGASEELESLRGRVEKFIGDALMAVFGIPHAHEDDALRAVRAGLAISDRTERLGKELGLDGPLAVRVGISSGPVATGITPANLDPEATDQLLVSGAPVNLAMRIQQAAQPGEVVVSETTYQLTRHAVEFGPPREVAAKGFGDTVLVWPAHSLLARSTRRTIPLVDRRRELSLLRDTLDRVRETSRAHLVTMLGEAGIGKTRLADELLAGLPEEATVLSGRATEYSEDATFAPIAEMVRRQLGVEEGAAPEVLRSRLEDVVSGCCDPTEIERVVARLGLALGLGDDHGEEAGEGAGEAQRYRSAEIRAGFMALLEGMARTGLVVLVFDDLHLARPALLELIENLVRGARRIPLLVLCLAREWLLEERPHWAGGLTDAVTLRIDVLSPREAAALAVSAGENVDEATAERIAQHTGGNPFFIVETTGMLLHEHVDDMVSALHSHLLPPTVQAVIASRIDHLREPARDLLRKASVFARSEFSAAELEFIAEPKEDVLRELEESEIFIRDPDRPDVWRFRHDLLRDVAYESLAKRDRLRLHVTVADRLLEQGKDRHQGAIAYHLEQAARAALDLDLNDRELAERAIPQLVRAGHLARWRMESRAAIDLYERALALTLPEEMWGPREAKVLSSIGECRYWLGEYDEAVAALRRALEIAGDDTWTRTHALRFLGDITLNVEGEPEQASEMFDQALAAAREHGDQWAMARTLLMAGWAPYWREDLEGARVMFEEALAVARAEPRRDGWSEVRALTSLISVTSPVGDELECLALGEEALAVARDIGDAFSVAVAQGYMANSLRRMLRLDEALDSVEHALRIFRDLDARWEIASTLGDRASILRLLGRFDDAEADYKEAVKICRTLGERNLIVWTMADLVALVAERGEPDRARDLFIKYRADLDRETPPQTNLAGIEALLALVEGDPDRALERSLWILETRQQTGHRNPIAAYTWWVGRVFGAEQVGGEKVLEEARETLEAAHWLQALQEPERAPVAMSEGLSQGT
jgi:class 3 adenylate cyclase/tetratricopeptide (TPR) repeat protein